MAAEAAVRWDERRLETYVDYGSVMRRMHHRAVRVAAYRGLGPDAAPLEPEDGMQALVAAEAE
jgi:hypothetical protein